MYLSSTSKAKKNKDQKSYGPEDTWRNDCGNVLFGFEVWVFRRGEQERGNAGKCTGSLDGRKNVRTYNAAAPANVRNRRKGGEEIILSIYFSF